MTRWHPPKRGEFEATALPIWREALVGIDWLALRMSAVYRGVGIPRGDGSAVVLIPGFLASDQYLGDMFSWLRRIGYQPYMSGMGRNAECPHILCARLTETVSSAYLDTRRKVHLIGHSLGGTLARSIGVRQPHLVASVVAMASPLRAVRAHPMVLSAAAFVRRRIFSRRKVEPGCYTGSCSCGFLNSLRRPLARSITHAAIYTKADGIIDWRCCINDDPDTDIEVRGTHLGLVFNPQVYRHIANILASAGERSQGLADSQSA